MSVCKKLSRYEMKSHHRAAACIHGYSPCPETHPSCVLFTCRVCGCSEAELPTECPGFKVDRAIREKFLNGELDYRAGEFITLIKEPV